MRHQNHENQENLEESHISTSSSFSQSRTGAPHDTALKNFTQKPLQKTVRKNAKAKELFLFCIESLQIEEPEYFGLYYLDRSGQRVWLTLHKSIADQLGFLKFRAWNFHFGIKHYPKLNGNWGNLNKTTFEIMYCNIREDVASGHLPASFVAHVLLGSLAKKIDGILFGQNPENRQDDTLKIIKYAPNQTEKLNSQISALYERKNDLSLFEAMVQYVEYASKLQMFGIQLFLAKDENTVDIQIGIGQNGIEIFHDSRSIIKYLWVSITSINYRQNKFLLELQATSPLLSSQKGHRDYLSTSKSSRFV